MPLTQLCCCCTSARKTGQKRENTFNGHCGITLSSAGRFLLQQERCHRPQDAPVALEHQQRLEEAFSWLLQRNKSTAGGWRHRGGFLRLPAAGALCMGGSRGSSPAPSRRALPRLLRGGMGSTGGSSSLGSLHGGSGAGIWLAPQPPVPRFGLCRRDGRGLPHGAAQGTQPALAAPWAPRLPPHPAGVPCPPSTQVTPGSLNAL